MAAERQAPDAIAASSNLAGSVASIQDDPDSPDANWLTAADVTADTEARVTFPSPTGNPTTGAGLQEFRVQARRTNTGGSSGTPTLAVELYENGVLVSSLTSGVGISSTSGQVVSVTWDASSIGTADGSLVECRVVGTNTGGKPSKRRTVEIGAIEWNVDYQVSEDVTGTGALASAAAQLFGSGVQVNTGQGSLSAGAAGFSGVGSQIVSGSGTISPGAASLSGVGSVETGTVEGSGTLTAGVASFSGGGVQIVVGSSVLQAGSATISGSGLQAVSGSGGLESGPASLVGVGTGGSATLGKWYPSKGMMGGIGRFLR